MKKIKLSPGAVLFALVLFFARTVVFGQTLPIYDRFGKKYSPEEITVNDEQGASVPGTSKSKYGTASVNSVPPMICGLFELHFEAGCGMDGTSSLDISRRNVLCQVFTDVSNMINSPLTSNLNPQTNKVKILVRDITNMASPVGSLLGIASPYYLMPPNFAGTNSSHIIDSEIWKTINTGINSYANNASVFPGGALGMFHGAIAFSFANPAVNWHYNLSTTPAFADFDFYTVGLHEVGHLLGFLSLMDYNGQGLGTRPYYSRYDAFLRSGLNTLPLINQLSGCGPQFIQYNPATPAYNHLSPGQPNCGTLPSQASQPLINCNTAVRYNSALNANIPVYTPGCFNVSSLSHFEDQCSPWNNNTAYFVMSEATSNGSMKRYFKPEERNVFCDLGYNLNATFGNSSNLNYYNYGGACNTPIVAGVNDGVVNGAQLSIVTPVGSPVSISPLTNDVGATSFTCMQVVLGGGSISNTSGTSFVFTPSMPGIHILQYYPINTSINKKGNITHVLVFAKDNCPINCAVTSNDGFENSTGCADWQQLAFGHPSHPRNSTMPYISCWTSIAGTTDLYTRNCNNTMYGPISNLPSSSFPTINSPNWPAAGNDRILGFVAGEGIQNQLAAPLIPNTMYQIRFNVIQATTNPSGPDIIVVGSNLPGTPDLSTSPLTAINVPGYYTPINSYQVNNTNWISYSTIFTYTGSSQANYVSIFNGNYLPNQGGYFMVDDFNIIELGTPSGAPGFTLPAQMCSNQSIPNLAANVFPSSAIAQGGYFVGPGIQNTNGVWSLDLTSLPLGLTTYSFIYTNTLTGCSYTITPQVNILPPASISISGPTQICQNLGATSVVLTANASPSLPPGVTYTWQPGNMQGPSVTLSPAVSTIYTVSANMGCIATSTVLVSVSNSCCAQSTLSAYTALTSNVIPAGTTLSGQIIINQNTTIGGTSTGNVNFSNGEFLIAPNVILTITPATQLVLSGAHLYACNTNMWQGMVIQNGGRVQSMPGTTNVTLIEDAIVAIDIDNMTSAIAVPPIEINGTIFNKNHVSIRVRNGSQTVLNLPILSTVFTSRNLPFTPTSWPNSSTTAPGLRAAINPTTGLIAPYTLQNYAFANLKNPYASQPAHIGVEINNVGNIPGGTPASGVAVGFVNQTSAGSFNLYDGLGEGMDVTNASLTTANNVFQNMKFYSTPGGMFGGKGIKHTVTSGSLMNAMLNLSPTGAPAQNTNYGNRFWDCYSGIEASNIYNVSIEHGIYRSTQSTNVINAYLPGSLGIYLVTNRYNYTIKNTEFNNISSGIWINVNSGAYNMGSGTSTGIYASNLNISQNYFGPKVTSTAAITTEYSGDAIHLNAPATTGWQVIGTGVIQSNKINRAYRGITVTGLGGYPLLIGGNLISLRDDNIFTQPRQYGIQALSTLGALSIASNTLIGSGITNTLITLIHSNANNRPLVECNNLSSSYQAFEFEGANPNTSWKGNLMQNHVRGLVLNNSGVIGAQGLSNQPCDNMWNGTWALPSYETFVIGSNALSSPLWVRAGVPFYPFNNGTSAGTAYGVSSLNTTSGAPFVCKNYSFPTLPTQKVVTSIDVTDNESEEHLNLAIFPNPTSGKFTVQGFTENESAFIRIFDVSGKIVYSAMKYGASHDIDLSVFDNGIYLLEIERGKSKVSRKLILSK